MVVVAIVERDAAQWRPRLEAVHKESWSHAPDSAPRLLVVDRATQAALDELTAAGLIAKTTAAVRALHPPAVAAAPPLTPEDRDRADFQIAIARRRLQAARALLGATLGEEAALAASEALHALTRARDRASPARSAGARRLRTSSMAAGLASGQAPVHRGSRGRTREYRHHRTR
jgi:hypothetical protein